MIRVIEGVPCALAKLVTKKTVHGQSDVIIEIDGLPVAGQYNLSETALELIRQGSLKDGSLIYLECTSVSTTPLLDAEGHVVIHNEITERNGEDSQRTPAEAG